jgi:phosphoribosylformimino-5-aminoimidazole carboxamide ribotide isomerase
MFSLDLKGGLPLADRQAWGEADAWAVAERAVGLGVRRLLVLDLARVGEGSGPGTEALCARLVREFPGLEVSAGGGVRGVADLGRLRDAGVAAVLVASALHDGILSPEDVARLSDG